jgi:hypothetical protein
MPLATKNNAIIVKDGRLAENCGCCACPAKLRITLNNLPEKCLSGYADLITRDLPTYNSCSFVVFLRNKVSGQSSCQYVALLPSPVNLGCISRPSIEVTLDSTSDTLSIKYFGSPAILLPEQGKSFATIPYNGGVRVASVGGTGCSEASWSAITLTIDTDTPEFLPSSCPANTSCTESVDTSPGPANTYEFDNPMCVACDNNRRLFVPAAAFVSSSFPEMPVPELNVQLNIGEFIIKDRRGDGDLAVDNDNYFPDTSNGLKSMSGAYALKYANDTCYFAQEVGVLNDDFTVADFNYPGSRRQLPPGAGWQGTFYSTDYGASDSGKGYEIPVDRNNGQLNGLHPDGLRFVAAVQIVVAPLGVDAKHDTSAKQSTISRCGSGEVAYQVRVRFFYSGNPDSGFGYYKSFIYWNSPLSVYASVPCRGMNCLSPPSFSVSASVNCMPAVMYGCYRGAPYILPPCGFLTAPATMSFSLQTQ